MWKCGSQIMLLKTPNLFLLVGEIMIKVEFVGRVGMMTDNSLKLACGLYVKM